MASTTKTSSLKGMAPQCIKEDTEAHIMNTGLESGNGDHCACYYIFLPSFAFKPEFPGHFIHGVTLTSTYYLE